MRQKGLKNSSKSQQGSLNSAEVWMTPGSLPLPSRLSQTIWWPEMLSGPFLTSASYLDVSPCGTLAHTCKKNLWNTLDSDKRRPPSYPLHLTDHPRRPSETGKKDSLDWILSNQYAVHSKSSSQKQSSGLHLQLCCRWPEMAHFGNSKRVRGTCENTHDRKGGSARDEACS